MEYKGIIRDSEFSVQFTAKSADAGCAIRGAFPQNSAIYSKLCKPNMLTQYIRLSPVGVKTQQVDCSHTIHYSRMR